MSTPLSTNLGNLPFHIYPYVFAHLDEAALRNLKSVSKRLNTAFSQFETCRAVTFPKEKAKQQPPACNKIFERIFRKIFPEIAISNEDSAKFFIEMFHVHEEIACDRMQDWYDYEGVYERSKVKFQLMPYLSPESIEEIGRLLSPQKAKELLSKTLPSHETVKDLLSNLYKEYFNQNCLLFNSVNALIEKTPPEFLVYLTKKPFLCQLTLSTFFMLKSAHLKIIVPQLSPHVFVNFVLEYLSQGNQSSILRRLGCLANATNEQKIHFMRSFSYQLILSPEMVDSFNVLKKLIARYQANSLSLTQLEAIQSQVNNISHSLQVEVSVRQRWLKNLQTVILLRASEELEIVLKKKVQTAEVVFAQIEQYAIDCSQEVEKIGMEIE